MLWPGVAGLRFKIIGGQVAIPGANGQTSSAPEQLTPLTTEELFLSALLGSASPLPPPPPPSRQTLSDIRAFLVNYHVRTIVADPIGHDPDLVVRYVDGALNETPRDEGGVELWPVALRPGEPPSADRADTADASASSGGCATPLSGRPRGSRRSAGNSLGNSYDPLKLACDLLGSTGTEPVDDYFEVDTDATTT